MLTQKFFYPLYDTFDENFFASLKEAVKLRYEFVGDNDEKVFFVKSLLCFQMLKDYRVPLHPIQDNLTKKTNLKAINDALKSQGFSAGGSLADKLLSVFQWKRDKEMGRLAKKFFKANVKIIGTSDQFNEFVLRYLISIWLVDWEGPLYAVLQSTKDGTVRLKELNDILALWDFTKIFASYK